MLEEIKSDFLKNDSKEIGIKLKNPEYKSHFFEFLCVELQDQANDFGYPLAQLVNSKINEYEELVKNLSSEEIEPVLEKSENKNTLIENLKNYTSGQINHEFVLDFIDSNFVEMIIDIDMNLIKSFFEKISNDSNIEKSIKIKFKKYQFNYTRKQLLKKEESQDTKKEDSKESS